tara:strand:- start:859 stop:1614 length:756 start_codon:yes stop_codon:yes gene_type:complete
MEIVAITTDKKGKRFLSFIQNNAHLKIKPFEAIIGNKLSSKDILRENLATSDFLFNSDLFSYGAIGCAASHKKIWERSIEKNKDFLVFEDDCYSHPKIESFIKTNKKILSSIDICFFGLTTNSVIQVKSQQNLQFSSIYFDPEYPESDWIKNAFSKTDLSKIILNKLIIGFGFWAYYLTPKGARKLIELIFPLSLKTTPIPLINFGQTQQMPLISIDRAGCAIYKEIDVLMTYPFLAYNSNRLVSTTDYLS